MNLKNSEKQSYECQNAELQVTESGPNITFTVLTHNIKAFFIIYNYFTHDCYNYKIQ